MSNFGYFRPAQNPLQLRPPKMLKDRSVVSYCRARRKWNWSVLIGGMVVGSGSEDTEAEAWDEVRRLTSPAEQRSTPVIWSYGVTTVAERRSTYLPRTLASLESAGFPGPRLFIDGVWSPEQYQQDLSHTVRFPRMGAWGNWILSLYELYIREPVCERYAIFQDDVVACKGLREYLDRCRYPDGTDGREAGYWNLFTFKDAEWDARPKGGWRQSPIRSGDPHSNEQTGRGALGYVFNREAVIALLSSPCIARKPATSGDTPPRNIDGAVQTAMNLCREDHIDGHWVRVRPRGYREYVHDPSLLQHIGTESSLGTGKVWDKSSETFPGESWDVREM